MFLCVSFFSGTPYQSGYMSDCLKTTVNRRRLIAAMGTSITTVTAGCAGFLNENSSMFSDGKILQVSPGSLLLEPNELTEEERNPWVESEHETSSNQARQILWVKNEEDVQPVEKFWRYLVVRVDVFEDIDSAKEEYTETKRIFENSSGLLGPGDSDLGDEGVFFAPDADDTHLIFRENNIFVDIVEMEGGNGAEKVVREAGRLCASKFSDSVSTS